MRKISGISILITVIFCVFSTNSYSQVSPDEGRLLLQQKGIPEDTLRARMLIKGYDIDNITPSQIENFQDVLSTTIAEIESDFARRKAEQQLSQTLETESVAKPADTTSTSKEPVSIKTESPEIAEDASRVYGQQIFRNNQLKTYHTRTDVKPPGSYVIGPRDKISVVIWGLSQFNAVYEVDRSGFINPDRMPRISLSGMQFDQARELIKSRFRGYYSFNQGEFEVTIPESREITINVFGETNQTGSINLPATNTAFNALAAVGGTKENGSMRNIKVISGTTEKILDVYEFMIDPTVSSEFYMQENDYIFVPTVENAGNKIVKISGAINRSFKYELTDGENLNQLIEFAGGLKPGAYLRDVQITRFSNDERIVTNINLREILNSNGDYELYNGDEVVIKSINDDIENFVEVQGEVIKPGRYERDNDMRISDLVSESALKPTSRRDFAYLLRYRPNGTYQFERINLNDAINNPGSNADPVLNNLDVLQVMSLQDFADTNSFQVSGAVRSPGVYQFDPGGVLKLEDAILLSGGPTPGSAEFGYIVRKDPTEPKTLEYIPFNLNDALSNPTSSENKIILDGDNIQIFNKAEFRDEFFVRVSGAVRNPGQFEYDPNMTITDVLKLAGGLTFSAASNKIDISRIIFSENAPTQVAVFTAEVDHTLDSVTTSSQTTLMPFDHVIVRTVPEFELQKTVEILGEVKYPGFYSITSDNEKITSIIERAGGLTPEAFKEGASLFRMEDSIGNVVIDLDKAYRSPNSTFNLILKDRDRINIPKQEDLVTIKGEINLRDFYTDDFLANGEIINVQYQPGKSAKYYIDEFAAGISENGARRLITVEHPNGRIAKTKSFLWFKSYPKVTKGSTISVGRKPVKITGSGEEKESVDWGNVIKDTIAQATAVLTLILLIDRID